MNEKMEGSCKGNSHMIGIGLSTLYLCLPQTKAGYMNDCPSFCAVILLFCSKTCDLFVLIAWALGGKSVESIGSSLGNLGKLKCCIFI